MKQWPPHLLWEKHEQFWSKWWKIFVIPGPIQREDQGRVGGLQKMVWVGVRQVPRLQKQVGWWNWLGLVAAKMKLLYAFGASFAFWQVLDEFSLLKVDFG